MVAVVKYRRFLVALMVLTPLAAWCSGGEVYPVEELAGGSCYLGFARFGSALAGPAEAAINPAGLAYALNSALIGTATAAPFLNNALYACYGLNRGADTHPDDCWREG